MTNLVQTFTGGYLYEGYEDDFADFEDALGSFLDDIDDATQRQFVDEMKTILVLYNSEESLAEAMDDLGWEIESEDGSVREAMEYAIHLIQEYIDAD